MKNFYSVARFSKSKPNPLPENCQDLVSRIKDCNLLQSPHPW